MIRNPKQTELKLRRLRGLVVLSLASIALSACNGSKTPRPEALIPQELPLTGGDGRITLSQAEAIPEYGAGSLAFSDIALHPVGPRINPSSAHVSNKTKFSSRAYGVSGSPRLSTSVNVRKGGGSYKIGKPYRIRGVRYVPKLDKNYVRRGTASWYGPNFHGRLTANGEVYDQYALSAAHPTMPLPSYARVTNLENGASVLVRVNDRGPYSKGRIIDLSTRAAQLLGYTKSGTAKVKVAYVGKARMDGLDEDYLVASYDPGMLDPATIPPNGRDILFAQNGELPATPPQPKLRAGAKNKSKNSFLAALFGWTGKKDYAISTVPVSGRRPLSGLTGFAPASQKSAAQTMIEAFDNKEFLLPDSGMGSLVGFVVGPAKDRHEAKKISRLLSNFGPHHMINDVSAGRYFYVTTGREDVAELQQAISDLR